jgi:hypothetical protein
MKRLLFSVVCVAAVLFVLPACSKDDRAVLKTSEYTLRVSGTPGLKFSANLGGASLINGPSGQSFEGTVPAEYKMVGTVVGCTFQKLAQHGTLKIEIIRDGKVVAHSQTSDPHGVAMAVAGEE